MSLSNKKKTQSTSDIFDDDFEVIYEGDLPDISIDDDDDYRDVLSGLSDIDHTDYIKKNDYDRLTKKLKNKKQDKQSEKPVPRKKEEEQTEGTGRNSAQNPCYGLLVCTGISYIYCLDFKNKNPGSYFNTSVSLADHY